MKFNEITALGSTRFTYKDENEIFKFRVPTAGDIIGGCEHEEVINLILKDPSEIEKTINSDGGIKLEVKTTLDAIKLFAKHGGLRDKIDNFFDYILFSKEETISDKAMTFIIDAIKFCCSTATEEDVKKKKEEDDENIPEAMRAFIKRKRELQEKVNKAKAKNKKNKGGSVDMADVLFVVAAEFPQYTIEDLLQKTFVSIVWLFRKCYIKEGHRVKLTILPHTTDKKFKYEYLI